MTRPAAPARPAPFHASSSYLSLAREELSMHPSSHPVPPRNAPVPGVRLLVLALAAVPPGVAAAFDSGSTGADGALAPTVNTEVQLPPSGVLNYTSINIPTGVTVRFKRNTTNTPVVLLVSGAATIAGAINVNGASSAAAGASGDGNIGDDGIAGLGGPGGYDGGRGGRPGSTAALIVAGPGLGPGGGGAGSYTNNNVTQIYGGGGAGFGAAGTGGYTSAVGRLGNGGPVYGSATLLPLIGGSGGGGGPGGSNFGGAGGGGGGGALLIAATGTITISGSITASAGTSGGSAGAGCGAPGGAGSGGAIRLVATTIAGNGTISAVGGAEVDAANACGSWTPSGGPGGTGRVRLEAETITRTAASNPAHTFAAPGPIFINGLPTLAITSVAGVSVPATPTGVADVSLPSTTTNPVAIGFQTTGVPVGNTITLKVTPSYGNAVSAVSTALSGSTSAATASASINLPTGASRLQASVTYTIVVAMGDALARYAQNERVEKIMLTATPGGASQAVLITVSGRQFDAPPEAMRIAAMGG
jgi:hypothetical protein